ncbi:MAG: amidohydrolase [Bacteroidetes bacterium]|nr:MAG: amidohydrolase [Bacteroidota bacterium]
MKKLLGLILTYVLVIQCYAQTTYPLNGVHDNRASHFAFKNAKIFIDYQTVVNGTLVINNGKVTAVGTDASIPSDAVVYDLNGKYIYPSFIDAYTSYGLPKVKKVSIKDRWNKKSQTVSNKKGPYSWNQAIKSENKAVDHFEVDSAAAEKMRRLGFGSVLSYTKDGVARGSSVLVNLSNGRNNNAIIKDQLAAHYSFKKGTSTQDYPSSLMGSIALIRQTFADAYWHEQENNKAEHNVSLQAWSELQYLPQVFEVDNKLSALRADKLGDEFSVQYVIKGGGDEYQRTAEIKATKASFIIPLNFPKAYDVEDPYDALNVTLRQMKHWELAPTNPGALENAGVNFAITTSDLKNKNEFWKNLRKAIKYGLSEKQALKSLTFSPAKILKVNSELGSLQVGKRANFIITSGNIFNKDEFIYQNWVNGKAYEIVDIDQTDIRGTYELKVGNLKPFQILIEGNFKKPIFKFADSDTSKGKLTGKIKGKSIVLTFKAAKPAKGVVRLNGWIDTKVNKPYLTGDGQMPNGNWIKWTATYKEVFKKKESEKKEEELKLGELTYPLGAYGWKELPKQEVTLIKNATVWTNGPEGVLSNTDVAIQNGKIIAVGSGLNPTFVFQGEASPKIINAKGKYVSSGIIDEHSHIAISKGVNEGTQANSAEVSIADVVNSDDVNMYRQLAGGVTAAQLLHGSANPIGGRSALIKFRWGSSPEEMKIKDADGFIKFALGENVKQANWGDNKKTRFPQTRMGVEQVYFDAFTRAQQYLKAHEEYNKLSRKQQQNAVAPRVDYEMEVLVEILNGYRHITCHSYIQSEINMLMKTAENFGFKINTFTHILEGYKVADKMKAHGAGGSSFSDWWAYKYEVMDAIPYNGAIMNKMGVVTAYNSDDAEMGRRLNQEAAKAVKYGGTSEEDAFKFVTLNPAKLLHLEARMGSIEVGKDADVVIWSDNPLSIYAKCEKTFVDGICYYDIDKDKELRKEIKSERARLIQKMLKAKKSGAKTQKPKKKSPHLYHCDDVGDYLVE